ncbi:MULTISPECIES: P22 phage major capsid protein family protein [Actinomadura]|uniref:P22 phage major capsid protein family protein n=1 Tax=Actinomadura yumaensis TaxID=111807 RepID=A0ABW2CG27_9ACTN|nr:P22 phage major capsid protein family protein [Actinomadura sp. J1-007]MWK34597.1 hypothetical protein [Actinomadura sp. J1-007]
MAINPTPVYTNDGTSTFIPEIWNAELVVGLDAQLVFASPLVANRDYEGDIQAQGDTVAINAMIAPEVGRYDDTKGMDIQDLKTIAQKLLISEADYVAFFVRDIERAQAAGALDSPAIKRAILSLAKSVDTFVGGVIATSATAYAPALDLSKVTAPVEKGEALLEAIFDAMEQLDSTDAPPDGRYVVVSPKAKRYLVRAEAVANASAYGEDGATKNGVIARLAGFTILTTTNMPAGMDFVAGQREFTTFAQQFLGFRDQPVEKFRRDQIDALNVYGAKVVRFPELDTVTADGKSFDESKPSKGLIKAAVKWAA